VMKRLQTGLRVNSAAEDVGALIQGSILTRAIRTLEIASEQLTRADSILQNMEETVKKITDILNQMRENALRAVVATDPDERAQLQAATDRLYLDIRELVRTTVFQQAQLLRGGLGNKMIAPATVLLTLSGSITTTLYIGNFDVSGINLAGYASGSLADTTVANLVTVIGSGTPGAMFVQSVPLNGQASVLLTMSGGLATAVLYIGGSAVFTEVISITFTGAQVLDFKNLGFRVFVDDVRFGAASQISAVITVKREEVKVFRGMDVGSELDYVRFNVPNMEPENLLETSLGGGTLFTFDLRVAPETAVKLIDEAIDYVEKVRGVIGAAMSLMRAANDQVLNQKIQAATQRSAIIDTKFDEEALRLTALQVIQQSATAMIAISRLTPQLVLQLIGGGG
jgi:flagellin-like hook-associated protein FlgL